MSALATPGKETRSKARQILCDAVHIETSDLPNGVFPTKKHWWNVCSTFSVLSEQQGSQNQGGCSKGS